MIVVLIDDEPLILAHQKAIVNEFTSIHSVHTLTTATEALRVIQDVQPQLILLDIEMPGKNGIELAKEIKHDFPKTEIVFLTAYSEYALESYEIDALDYLVKPLTKERMKRVLTRLQSRLDRSPDKGYLRLLGGIDFELPSGEKIVPKWRTTKAKEVFSYLLHHRGRAVSKENLIEQFWNDASFEKRFDQLYATIYQIRKTLATLPFSIQLENQQEGYLLQLIDLEVDVDHFENGLKNARLEDLEEVVRLYRGEYLRDSSGVWVENERERFRALWREGCGKLADHFSKTDRIPDAIALNLKVQDICPYEEDIYFELMQLYAQKNERFSVEKQYERLTTMLQDEYGSAPKKHVEEWYVSWKRNLV